MLMAKTYRVVKPLSQAMFSQDSYEGEGQNRTPNGANDDDMQNVPKRFSICGKCKLQRMLSDPTASVEKPSQTCHREADSEWLSQGDNLSSMKLLSMLMLNAWRQRRNEVKELQQVMAGIKDENMKYKNQMHVYSTLVRVEQKRNDELTLQLKLSLESINQVRYSCDNLTTSVINLTADKEQLRMELENRKQEYEAQKSSLKHTKNDLIRSLRDQMDLQTRLAKEQRALEEADQNHKHVLERMKGLLKLHDGMRQTEQDYYYQIKEREDTIKELCSDVFTLRDKLRDHEEGSKRIMSESMLNMNAEIVSLKAQLEEQTKVMFSFVTANTYNRSTFGNWESMLQSFALNFLNVVLYLLPAMPSSTQDVKDFYNFDNKTNRMDNKRKMRIKVRN